MKVIARALGLWLLWLPSATAQTPPPPLPEDTATEPTPPDTATEPAAPVIPPLPDAEAPPLPPDDEDPPPPPDDEDPPSPDAERPPPQRVRLEEPEPTSADLNVAAPTFAMLGRTDSRSRAGVDVAFLLDKMGTTSFRRLGLHGQLAVALGGYFVGGYANMSMSNAIGEADGTGAISGVSVGGFFGIDRGLTEVIFSSGMIFPTASGGDGFGLNLITSAARPNDIATTYPETRTLRFGLAVQHAREKYFLRAEGGLDLQIGWPGSRDRRTLMHLGVGGGLVSEMGRVSLEFAHGTSNTGFVMNSLALGYELARWSVRPSLSFIVPTSDPFDATGIVVMVGAQFVH